jgi:hypothetical protein
MPSRFTDLGSVNEDIELRKVAEGFISETLLLFGEAIRHAASFAGYADIPEDLFFRVKHTSYHLYANTTEFITRMERDMTPHNRAVLETLMIVCVACISVILLRVCVLCVCSRGCVSRHLKID